MEQHIIGQPWGGLGDNLQLSTLPELFHERGHRVLIARDNAVRNQEIFDLVWGRNPYIAGIADAEATDGFPRLPGINRVSWTHSFIERVEIAHGLEPRNRYPKVYYRPTPDPRGAGRVLIDIGSSSTVFPPEMIAVYLGRMIESYQYPLDDIRQLRLAENVCKHPARLRSFPEIEVGSIFEYCDLLASCRALLTVWSGAHALAAAIRGDSPYPAIHCLITVNGFNGRIHQYPNVDYHIAVL